MDFASFSTFNPCTHARLSRSPCPTSGIKPRFNPNSNLSRSIGGFSSRRFLIPSCCETLMFLPLGIEKLMLSWRVQWDSPSTFSPNEIKRRRERWLWSLFGASLSNRREKNQPRQSRRPKSTTFAAKHVWIKCTPLMEQASPHFLRKVQVFEGRVSQ